MHIDPGLVAELSIERLTIAGDCNQEHVTSPWQQTKPSSKFEDLQPENLKRLREHKRIERNRKLATKVKKVQGYTCKACDFNFERAYGSIGVQYIESGSEGGSMMASVAHIGVRLAPRTHQAAEYSVLTTTATLTFLT